MSTLLNETTVLDLFLSSGALLRGHFKLTSGRHSDVYYEKFTILKNPAACGPLCDTLAEKFRVSAIDTVVGPTTGGVIIAYEVARALGVTAVYAEPADSPATGRVFKRGFSLARGERVLIVDDVLTTGRSLDEVTDLVKSYGAVIVGIGVFLDRSGGKAPTEYEFLALTNVAAQSWEPENCPLCQKSEPFTQRGSRK